MVNCVHRPVWQRHINNNNNKKKKRGEGKTPTFFFPFPLRVRVRAIVMAPFRIVSSRHVSGDGRFASVEQVFDSLSRVVPSVVILLLLLLYVQLISFVGVGAVVVVVSVAGGNDAICVLASSRDTLTILEVNQVCS